ncbi:MAG TPA: hypothetical protein DDZ51_27245 [Planctomycetaceae bacterium]|nr:hypothetical protein [Planctomycetaceae bacterium]
MNAESQSLARKSWWVNTPTIIPKLSITTVFGLSLTIAAHYDKGSKTVFLASWTQATALLFAASSI